MKTLPKTKTDKFDKILKDSSIKAEIDAGKIISKEEKVKLKSYSIKTKTKLGKFTVTI